MAVRIGTLIPAPLRIQDDTIPYAVCYASEIKGGAHAGDTMVERNNLEVHYRSFGMLFSVLNDPTPSNNGTYQLLPSVDSDITNNANWIKLFEPNPQGLVLDKVTYNTPAAVETYSLAAGWLIERILVLPASGSCLVLIDDSVIDGSTEGPDMSVDTNGRVFDVNYFAHTIKTIYVRGLNDGALVVYFKRKII